MKTKVLPYCLALLIGSNLHASSENKALQAFKEVGKALSLYVDKPLCLWHEIESFSSSDGSLKLEDSSVWLVHPNDRKILQGWKNHDLIFIQQSADLLAPCNYLLTNQTTSESLHANLSLPPDPKSQHAFRIKDLDRGNGHVHLQDGSIWNTCFFYMPKLKNWKAGDPILVGLNGSNFIRGDYLLINLALDEFVYVNLLQKGESYE